MRVGPPAGTRRGLPRRADNGTFSLAHHSRKSCVQLDIIALNLLYAVAGVVLMFVNA